MNYNLRELKKNYELKFYNKKFKNFKPRIKNEVYSNWTNAFRYCKKCIVEVTYENMKNILMIKMRSNTPIIFSQQILDSKLLLILIWTYDWNYFIAHRKKKKK